MNVSRTKVLVVASLVPALSWACGGEIPSPRIKNIKTVQVDDDGSGTPAVASSLIAVTYSDTGKLQTTTATVADVIDYQITYSYSDNRLSLVDWLDYDNGTAAGQSAVISIQYDDNGLVDNITTTSGPAVLEERYSYTSTQRLLQIERTDYAADTVETTDFDYDQQGRIVKVTTDFGLEERVAVVEWADDNNISEIADTFLGGTTVYTYKHDAFGRVERTNIMNVEITYDVTYRDDGNTAAVEFRTTNGTTNTSVTSEYSYGDGSVLGVTPNLGVPWGELFQIDGYAQPDYPILTTGAFFGT